MPSHSDKFFNLYLDVNLTMKLTFQKRKKKKGFQYDFTLYVHASVI